MLPIFTIDCAKCWKKRLTSAAYAFTSAAVWALLVSRTSSELRRPLPTRRFLK
uniref:Peroxidase 72 n=1 Tax=Arundo donax TaxID=35708 RepID=A0A0A8XSX8_ARUDO